MLDRPSASARRHAHRGSVAVAVAVALGMLVAATPPGKAATGAVRTQMTLAQLRREVPYPLYLPAYLPPGAQLAGTTTAAYQSEGLTAKLHYRVPTPTGDVGLIVHQSHPEHAFRLAIPAEQVSDRPQIGERETILYSSGGPPAGPPLLILAWTDGEYHFELWSALPAAELVKVARSLQRDR